MCRNHHEYGASSEAPGTEERNNNLAAGLHRQLAYTLRAATWFGLWFAIAARPLDWAKKADEWHKQSGQPIWESSFIRAHSVVWRLLLTFLLYTIVGLLAAAAGKALSLQFHHKNHFERMQARRLPQRVHIALAADLQCPVYVLACTLCSDEWRRSSRAHVTPS